LSFTNRTCRKSSQSPLPSKETATRHPSGVRKPTLGQVPDDLKVKAESGRVVSRAGKNADPVRAVQQRYGLTFERSVKLPQEKLDFLEARATRRSGRAQADIGGSMIVTGRSADLEHAANALLALDEVEYVQFISRSASSLCDMDADNPSVPGDYPTANYFNLGKQRYHGPNPGVYMGCAWHFFSELQWGKGKGIRIAAIEQSYRPEHEDLPCLIRGQGGTDPGDPPWNCVYSLQGQPQVNEDHGTASLGMLVGLDNGYGITGLVPEARAYFYSIRDQTTCLDDADDRENALVNARLALRRGDVIVIEVGTDITGANPVPMELDKPIWDQVSAATDEGIVVVAGAGNAGVSLDAVLPAPEGQDLTTWRKWGHDVRLWFRAEGGNAIGDQSDALFDNYKVDAQLVDGFTGTDDSTPGSIWTGSGSSTDAGSATIQSNRLRVRAERSATGPTPVRWLKHDQSYDIDIGHPTVFEVDFLSLTGSANRNASVLIVPEDYIDTEVARNGDDPQLCEDPGPCDDPTLAVTTSDDTALAGIWMRGTRVSAASPLPTPPATHVRVRIEMGAKVKVYYDGALKATGSVKGLDSGAILVGAGSPDVSHDETGRCHGSRVNVQGWGENVFTSGCHLGRTNPNCIDLDPGEVPEGKQLYTTGFNATSSAAPMVAGAVAALQSLRCGNDSACKDHFDDNNDLYRISLKTPHEMRDLLIATGKEQGAATRNTRPIGPFPNLAVAVTKLGIASVLDEDDPPDEVADACEQLTDPLFDSNIQTTRSLAITIPQPTPQTAGPIFSAIRVTPIDLQNPAPPNAPQFPPPAFGCWEAGSTCGTNVPPCVSTGEANDCARWVGLPALFLESQDSPSPVVFKAARLQCTPHYQEWGPEGLVHVIGAEIIPSSTYEVVHFANNCIGNEAACTYPYVSAAVAFTTRRYGDATTPFNPPSTETQPDAVDVNALVNKFKNLPGAIQKAFAQLQPNVPNLNADADALDIAETVNAFKGFAYPYGGPCRCPSQVTCGVTPCSSQSQCNQVPGGFFCVQTCTSGPRIGQPCNNNKQCGKCTTGPRAGYPCENSVEHCAGPLCETGVCGSGFCRDRCGRCN